MQVARRKSGSFFSASKIAPSVEDVERSLVRYEGVSVSFLRRFLVEVQEDLLAPGVRLFVATRDIDASVKQGRTIKLVKEFDDRFEGRVAYTGDVVIFTCEDAQEKPREDWTTEDITQFIVLPATTGLEQGEQFYTKLIPHDDIGEAYEGLYLSHAHECRFADLVQALVDYVEERALHLEAQFIWLDVFCSNQVLLTSSERPRPDIQGLREEILTEGLREAIARFDGSLILINQWDAPAPLGRAWCVWEIYGATTSTQPMQALLAPGQEEKYLKQLLDDAEVVYKVCTNYPDMRKAQCRKPDDKEMIDFAIERSIGGGFNVLNEIITDQVCSWFVQVGRDAISKAQKDGSDEVYVAQVFSQTGYLRQRQGYYHDALQLYDEALKLLQDSVGPEHEYIANTLNNIGGAYESLGELDEALAHYEEALGIVRDTLGPKDAKVASTLNNIGHLLSARQDYEEALQNFSEALVIRQEVLNEDDVSIAETLNNIAFIYQAQDRYEDARKLFEEAKTITEASYGPDHPDVALAFNNIGNVLRKEGSYEDAITYFKNAMDIFKQAYGPHHPLVAKTLHNIGLVYSDQGFWSEAIDYFQQASNLQIETLEIHHPDIAETSACLHQCRQKLRNSPS